MYKSRFFHKLLIANKAERPQSEDSHADLKTIYKHRVSFVKDRKMAGFNYEMLHDILPCNLNLVKWKS